MGHDTTAQSNPSNLAVVCWNDSDGTVQEACPLPRPHAEALARAFGRLDPKRDYWVRPVPWLQRPVAPGKGRRSPG